MLGRLPGVLNGWALRRRCKRRLTALGLSPDIGLEALREELQARRGRPITLVPLALSRQDPSITGAWWPGPREDLLFFELETGRIHQRQIIGHELSHIVCGHEPKPISGAALEVVTRAMRAALQKHLGSDVDLERLNPPLECGTVRLRGNASGDPDEEEAEAMASLLGARSSAAIPPLSTSRDPAISAVLERLEKALSTGKPSRASGG